VKLKVAKKGMSGISVLIIIIATILITILFIALYLSMTNKLESQSYKTVDSTKEAISTKLNLVDLVSIYEGINLQQFVATVRLETGSDLIDLRLLTISLSGEEEITSLSYGGISKTKGHDGYYTLGIGTYEMGDIPDDLDKDGQLDRIGILGNGDVELNLSSEGNLILGNCSSETEFQEYEINSQYVLNATGTCENSIVTEVIITPISIGDGKFTIDYIKTSPNHISGTIRKDEVVNIYFETQNPIPPDKIVEMFFIPKYGNPLLHIMVTPDVPKIGRVHLTHY
jgi:archaellin